MMCYVNNIVSAPKSHVRRDDIKGGFQPNAPHATQR